MSSAESTLIKNDMRSNLSQTPVGLVLKAIRQSQLDRTAVPPVYAAKYYKRFNRTMYAELKTISEVDDSVMAGKRVIVNEVFKKPIIWEQIFAVKCSACGYESDEETVYCEGCSKTLQSMIQHKERLEELSQDIDLDVSDKISAIESNIIGQKKKMANAKMLYPDKARMIEVRDWFSKSVNEFNKTYEDECREAQKNVVVYDDAALLFLKRYIWDDKTGTIDWKKVDVKAIESVDILSFDINIDESTGRMRNEYFCVNNRSKITKPTDRDFNSRCFVHTVPDKNGKPKMCGCDKLKAFYFIINAKGDKEYYAETEIIHWSYYNPSKYRGKSALWSAYELVLAKKGMDTELYDRYWNKTYPNDLIGVMTQDKEDLDRIKEEMLESAASRSPQIVGILPNPDGTYGKAPIVRVKLLDDSINDLLNSEGRTEVRNTVNRVLGIVPLATSDTEGSSALHGQGEQLVMLSRETESQQEKWTEKVFPRTVEMMRVFGYRMMLHNPNEDSALQIEELRTARINQSNNMVSQGYTSELVDQKEMTFKYSGTGERQSTAGFGDFAEESDREEDDKTEEIMDDATGNNDDNDSKVEKSDSMVMYKARFRTYKGMGRELSKLINDHIRRGNVFGETNLQIAEKIEFTDEWRSFVKKQHPTDTLQSALAKQEYRVDLIVRDQRQRLGRADKVNEFKSEDPEGKNRYEFIGPGIGDPRLSEHRCKKILERIPPEGATAVQIEQLIDEFGDEGKDVKSWTPGLQCRHDWGRVV